jgi:hypothetical protein
LYFVRDKKVIGVFIAFFVRRFLASSDAFSYIAVENA